MIFKVINELGPWVWWIVGFLFLIIEIFMPGAFFLWIGLAALIVGMNAMIIPMSWTVQIALFAILALVLAVVGRRIYKRFDSHDASTNINRRGMQLVGQTFVLTDDMNNGRGRVNVGDSQWMVEGEGDLPSGAEVRVTDVKGTVLLVEPNNS